MRKKRGSSPRIRSTWEQNNPILLYKEKHGYTYEELAARLCVSKQVVHSWVRGCVPRPAHYPLITLMLEITQEEYEDYLKTKNNYPKKEIKND